MWSPAQERVGERELGCSYLEWLFASVYAHVHHHARPHLRLVPAQITLVDHHLVNPLRCASSEPVRCSHEGHGLAGGGSVLWCVSV
jgi:hypothetical protein